MTILGFVLIVGGLLWTLCFWLAAGAADKVLGWDQLAGKPIAGLIVAAAGLALIVWK